ncbi:myotubularin-like phosphatase domain-containing protein [Ditylenchus destructor]|nr:myotubularin-like phosphatase domain-containing protein [Ditylenchus destructor]
MADLEEAFHEKFKDASYDPILFLSPSIPFVQTPIFYHSHCEYNDNTTEFDALVELSDDNWPVFQHFARLVTDPFIYIDFTISSEDDSYVLVEHPLREEPIIIDSADVPKKEYRWALKGEIVIFEQPNVGYPVFLDIKRKVKGTAYLTNYRLSKEDDYALEIKCKDLRVVRLLYVPGTKTRSLMLGQLEKYAFPKSHNRPFFATLYTQKFARDYWTLFDTEQEFVRQGLAVRGDQESASVKTWVIHKTINDDYALTPSYPSVLATVQKIVSSKILQRVAAFRGSKEGYNRLPALSWIDKKSGAALVRSAQPLVSILQYKSTADRMYLEQIIAANGKNPVEAKKLIILDARPKRNADANHWAGGGYENDYENCKIYWMDIDNIHEVRDSLKGLRQVCPKNSNDPSFKKALDDSKWLTHIKRILNAARRAVREIAENKNSVLVHCSDGWDRTPQITSLAMLQLDPYYRTLEGFAILIEKEWCSFGHRFAKRIGHGEQLFTNPLQTIASAPDKERSPIFVQFIDCVWQLVKQHPNAFEFNVKLLTTILDELYACRFGTFLYNSEKERRESEKSKKTISLWSYVLDNEAEFLNSSFNSSTSVDEFLKQPESDQTKVPMKFWSEYYCRHSEHNRQRTFDQ